MVIYLSPDMVERILVIKQTHAAKKDSIGNTNQPTYY